jgi:hypothetical protein
MGNQTSKQSQPFPKTNAPTDDSLLEANYAAYYGSDTFNERPSSPVKPKFAAQPFDPTTATLSGQTMHKHRVSELIDPKDLLPSEGRKSSESTSTTASDHSTPNWRKDSTPGRLGPIDRNKKLPALVESPSGKFFSPAEFAAHPHRPLAIRERQEQIMAAVETKYDIPVQPTPSPVKKSYGSISPRNRSFGSLSPIKTSFGSIDLPPPKMKPFRKGSDDSAISFGSTPSSSGYTTRNTSVSDGTPSTPSHLSFEQMKIMEGQREYEKKLARKERGEKGWNPFKKN